MRKIYLAVLPFFVCFSSAIAQVVYGEPIKKTSFIKKINDSSLGDIILIFSERSKETRIEIPKINAKSVVDEFEIAKSPSRVGSDIYIQFIPNKVVEISGRKFLGVSYSHRSRSNDGSGGCGSGSEEFFAAFEIRDNHLYKINNFIVQSCLHPYLLYSDGGNKPNQIATMDGVDVLFKWLSYEEFESPVLGRYNFIENILVLTSDVEN